MKTVPDMEDLGNALLEIDKILKFYSNVNTPEGRELIKLRNEKVDLGDRMIDAFQDAQFAMFKGEK
jgi:hypothetical protein